MIDVIFSNIYGILVFVVFLGILIGVHEWGHFITAKKLGVQVDEFAFGFGPTLFKRFSDGTTYFIKLFPLGGYVKMAGDERDKCTGAANEFYSKPIWARSLIVFNGPLINFVLAYVCLVFVFMFGYPELSPKVGELLESYPAIESGLMQGDWIEEVDGDRVESWTDLQEGIAQSTGDVIELQVKREGELVPIRIHPQIEASENIFGETVTRRLVGIVPSDETVSLTYGFGESFVLAGAKFVEFTQMTYKALFSMVTGSMSAKESVGGPVFIFTIVKNAAEKGLTHFIFILGVISLNLAIFNLLPVVPLDGGHILLYLIEGVRRKPLPEKVDNYVMNFGLTLIILLALFIFYVDFERIGLFDAIKNFFPKSKELF